MLCHGLISFMNFSALEILYTVLSVCTVALTIFLVVLLYRLIKAVGHFNALVEKIEYLAELAEHYIRMPLQVVQNLLKVWEGFSQRFRRGREKKSK